MKMEKKQDQVFGFNTSALLRKLSQSMSLSKMLRICSIKDLLPSSKICMNWGMMQNGELYQLDPLVPTISEKDFGSLPTPTAMNYGSNQGGAQGRIGKIRYSLESMAKMNLLPTPTTFDSGSPLPPRKKNPTGGQKPPLVSVVGGRLNPEFVEFMMGLPLGWTNVQENNE